METEKAVFETNIQGLSPPRRGKVRDVYDLGDSLLFVATDRISAFDAVFPTPIPDKGRILTELTVFWLDLLRNVVPNHLITSDLSSLPLAPDVLSMLAGRALVVKKAEGVPFECIVRGYIAGSGWKEYITGGEIGGLILPAGLKMAGKLPEPVFTPSIKATTGHDRNVSFRAMAETVGGDLAEKIRSVALALYDKAAGYALQRGIIIADTKFEFGLCDGGLVLIDEVLTPDSSRFWPREEWREGRNPPSFDKQYLRDWLESECMWNKTPPAPSLPERVVAATRKRYLDAFEIITGRKLDI